MIKRFTKGKLRKELVYIRAKMGEYRNQSHVVSQYPSDAQGRIQLMRERSEEFPHEKQAIECFGKWEQELMADGWTAEWRNAGKPPEAKKAMTDEQIRKMISLAVKSKPKAQQPAPKAEPKPGPKAKPPAEQNGGDDSTRKEEKTCPICGKTFMTDRRSQKYCCHNCANKAYKQNQKKATQAYLDKLKEAEIVYEERPCSICGKQFTPIRENQIYCSRECYREMRKLNDRCRKKKERQAKQAKKNAALVEEMEKQEMKTGNVLSWYESARYVITEFMNKAETEEDVKFISDALSGCLDNALKDAAVRLTIKKRYPMVLEPDESTKPGQVFDCVKEG